MQTESRARRGRRGSGAGSVSCEKTSVCGWFLLSPVRRKARDPYTPRTMRALVTGGTGRVGSAVAERLREEDWSVVASGRAQGDLSSADGARRLVEHAIEELGGLDLLVNAAGEGFAPKAVAEVTEADWDTALGATAKGSFFVTQAAAPHLSGNRGVVIMIEDVAAYEPWP